MIFSRKFALHHSSSSAYASPAKTNIDFSTLKAAAACRCYTLVSIGIEISLQCVRHNKSGHDIHSLALHSAGHSIRSHNMIKMATAREDHSQPLKARIAPHCYPGSAVREEGESLTQTQRSRYWRYIPRRFVDLGYFPHGMGLRRLIEVYMSTS